jgi:aspartate/methionine/tyrosine aminotransferase
MKGVLLVVTHKTPGDLPTGSTIPIHEQRAVLRALRGELIQHYRPLIYEGPGPIRVMARVVAELEQECHKRHVSREVMRSEIVNRTIGDVNLRLIVECEGEDGGSGDYRMLADELGVALPGEQLPCGYVANGETYLWLRKQAMEDERLLLEQRYDPRIYDIYGIGNPVLRERLAQEMLRWKLDVSASQVMLSLGAMDGIDKVLRGLAYQYRVKDNISDYAILFPEPGFNVPEWQARACGYRLYAFQTLPENRFKLTAGELDQILHDDPAVRIIYLSVTNNPTTFSYTPDELNALHNIVRSYREKGRDIFILADLAYIGTGKPEEDLARMATFAHPDTLRYSIFVSSFSKTHTLTGERFGWVTCGDPAVVPILSPAWTNTMASLPGEWQLRFMAYYRLIQEHPWLSEKLRNFYRLRRRSFIHQLNHVNEQLPLFDEVYIDDDATVYNWSKVRTGEDAFSLFEKTGIAGVPGSGFGYTDEYIRFSIGVVPID